ncbi:MAG TPA: helix-turn-helix domain-containing protein [Acidimicrobiales bacterium]|nr:helix-turn-helix domain-containing protein [Acidimicrobiales bacterium]
MGTVRRLDDHRGIAVRRFRNGESARSIALSLGRSSRWVYKWVARAAGGPPDWASDRSRRPHVSSQAVPPDVVEAVQLVRLELYNAGLLCGAQNIQWRLEDLAVTPLPSVRTIGRILAREGLTHRRTGRYAPKGTPYPTLPAGQVNQVHQIDYVGPCYLQGPVRFWSLNTVDVATVRCAVEPVTSRAGQATVDALWASWHRPGLPDAVQADNEMVFYGSPAHPRGLGVLIRLCLPLGIEPWFIPFQEPWRNGVVERFNTHFRSKFLAWVQIPDFPGLRPASRAFEQRHNGRYRYTRLHGQTPLGALAAAVHPLRFPAQEAPPTVPLPKPEVGRYHLVRFIRSDRRLDIFGERFLVPPEATYAYVVATIDVARQRLTVHLDTEPIVEWPYRLR